MSKNTQYKNQCIFWQVEDNEGVPQVADTASQIYVEDFEMDPYTGDTEELEIMCKDGGARSNQETMNNQHSTFSFKMPMTFPAALGQLPSWGGVLRCCNLDATQHADRVVFTPSASGEADSGTLTRLMEYDTTADHSYISAGARGQVDLVLEYGKRPYFQINSGMGSYILPDLNTFLACDCETLTNNLAENLAGELVNEITLAGVSLCARIITVKNIGMVELSRDGFLCPGGAQTLLADSQSTIEIEFENTDWAKDANGARVEFNPFELAESHNGIQLHPFVFDHGIATKGIKYESTQVQVTQPKVLETTGGRKGVSLVLRNISVPELTIY